MALRARLVAPPPPPKETWQWHKAKYAGVSVSALLSGDRRMEAETYLSSGFGIRAGIESKPKGWVRLNTLANVWMPGRLKGIQVSNQFGTPFLTATQVFDIRPVPRKWLALDRTADAASRFVRPGTILVTCSGSVGRPTLAYAPHENTLISHDLLRIEATDRSQQGWLYAYLHSPQVRAMATSAHYGHIIKHLETSHLDALPIPTVSEGVASEFARRLSQILDLRNEGHRLTLEAEALFAKAFGPIEIKDWGESGFSIKASESLFSNRRRLDAAVHNPGVASIRRHLSKNGQGFVTVAKAGYDVWLPTRFRRVPAQDGPLLVDSADLTEVNPDLTKRIADGSFGDAYRGRIKAGWILLARSGQTYGIIGTVVLAQQDLEDKIISDHVIRIRPKADALIEPGYLLTTLSHPIFGRPVLKSLAYGSSIPELEVTDIMAHEIVRLKKSDETAIAELAEASAKARAAADTLEREISTDAGTIIDRFMGVAGS